MKKKDWYIDWLIFLMYIIYESAHSFSNVSQHKFVYLKYILFVIFLSRGMQEHIFPLTGQLLLLSKFAKIYGILSHRDFT